MPWPKPDEAELQQREDRALEWLQFRKENMFTQQRLAEILGISRRTVQMVENGKITPHNNTVRLFNALRTRYQKAS